MSPSKYAIFQCGDNYAVGPVDSLIPLVHFDSLEKAKRHVVIVEKMAGQEHLYLEKHGWTVVPAEEYS